MSITTTIIFTIGLLVCVIQAELCARPEVEGKMIYIYRLKDTKNITIQNCFHIQSRNVVYSDITDNCVKALQSGVFLDKFNNTNKLVKYKGSKGYLINYSGTADRVENKVYLKSGTICRYDRGFCYDSRESNNYAVVWDIDFSPGAFTGDLIYQGIADIWSFKNNSLKYLFHEQKNKDEAFSFQLQKKGKIDNITFWYTEKKFVVADGPLFGKKISPVDIKELTVGTKSKVSEDILKSCDIQSLEFTQSELPVSEEYFTDPHNLITVLRTYGETISEISKQLKDNFGSETKKELDNKIDNYIKQVQIKIQQIDADIGNLSSNLVKLNDALKNHVTEFENFRKKLIDFDPRHLESDLTNKLNTNYNKLHNKLDELTKEFLETKNINLSAKLDNLNNVVLDLSTKNKDIFNTLSELKTKASKSISEKLVTELAANALKNVESKFDSELIKLSEKYNGLLKRIDETKNTNVVLNQKLMSLNQSMFDVSYNTSQLNSFSELQNQLENQIRDLQTAVKNLETKYLNDLQKRVQAENKILAEQYNLLKSRLTDDEKSISNLENEVEIIKKTLKDFNEENNTCTDSIVKFESTILQKFNNFQTSYNNDLKITKQTVLSEINTVKEKFDDLGKHGKSANGFTIIFDTTNQDIKNVSFSTEENNDQYKVILNNIKSIVPINKTVIQNTKNIAILFSRLEIERQNVEFLNEAVSKYLEDGKALYEKINKVERRQGNTELTLNFHTRKLTTMTDQINELMKNSNMNKPTSTSARGQASSECSECANTRFKALEQRFAALEDILAQKDEEIDGCHAELKELGRRKDEDIAKIKQEIDNLREEIKQGFVAPIY